MLDQCQCYSLIYQLTYHIHYKLRMLRWRPIARFFSSGKPGGQIKNTGRPGSENPLEKQPPKKSYRMPKRVEKKEFVPSMPLHFRNGRALLFLSKQHLLTPTINQLHFTIPMLTIAYLMRYNPWYLTFPASLPIMFITEMILLVRWILFKKHNKYCIERVYLYENNMVQLVFSNKIRGMLKDTEKNHVFPLIEELATPTNKGGQEWYQKGWPFPEQLVKSWNPVEYQGNLEDLDINYPPFLYYGWTKYTANFENYIFPKYYEYANWEVLIPIMKGMDINMKNKIDEPAAQCQAEYQPIEQALKLALEDRQKDKKKLQQELSRLQTLESLHKYSKKTQKEEEQVKIQSFLKEEAKLKEQLKLKEELRAKQQEQVKTKEQVKRKEQRKQKEEDKSKQQIKQKQQAKPKEKVKLMKSWSNFKQNFQKSMPEELSYALKMNQLISKSELTPEQVQQIKQYYKKTLPSWMKQPIENVLSQKQSITKKDNQKKKNSGK